MPWKGSAALPTCSVGLTRVLVAPTRSACGLVESIVISMQAVSSWPETMRMGSCGFNSLDQAACAVEIDLSGHAVGRSSAHTHTQGHGSLVRMHRVCQSLLAVDPSSLRAGCWSWSLNSTGRPAVRNSPRSPRGIVNPAERAGSTHLCCPLSSVIVFIVGHFVLGREILSSRIVDG
jgi:hypothetical protein